MGYFNVQRRCNAKLEFCKGNQNIGLTVTPSKLPIKFDKENA